MTAAGVAHLFEGIGTVAMGIGLWNLRKFFRLGRFPFVEGTLKSVQLGTGYNHGDFFWPRISYVYTVDGQEITASRYYSLADMSPTKGIAERVVKRLENAGAIRVYYDPARIDYSFLENGPLVTVVGWSGMGLLFVLFSLLYQFKSSGGAF